MNGQSLSPVFRIVLVLGMLAVLAPAATADEIYVPDNNPQTGSSNAIPFWAEWSKIQGQIRYQLLFTPDQLGNKGFTVTDIAFAANFTGYFRATQLQVRMSHSRVGSLNPTMDLNIPNPVTMYDGSFDRNATQGSWWPMGLTSRFSYNGNEFLVIDIRYKGGMTSYTVGSPGRCHQAPSIHRSWAYQDYNAKTQSGQDLLGGLKTQFTVGNVSQPAKIDGAGVPRPGGAMILSLTSRSDGNLPYQVGTSLGTGPIPIGSRTIGLGFDAILGASLLGLLPTVFVDYSGKLDAQGGAIAKLNILKEPLLVGVRLHSAFVTLNPSAPSGIQTISNTFSFTITK